MKSIIEKIEYRIKLAKERRDSAIKEINLHKNNPDALIIHEQIELMRANDEIELLNSLLDE